jgi:hypothetical protein
MPKDVANACAYLASEEAEFITGINLEVSRLSHCFQRRTISSWHFIHTMSCIGGWWSMCLNTGLCPELEGSRREG